MSGTGRVLDTSALRDAATGRTQYFRAVITTVVELGASLVIPTSAWTEAWALSDAADRIFLEFLTQAPKVMFAALDAGAARDCGDLAAAAVGTGLAWDVRTAHVTITALQVGYPVVTSEPGPLLELSPRVLIDQLP